MSDGIFHDVCSQESIVAAFGKAGCLLKSIKVSPVDEGHWDGARVHYETDGAVRGVMLISRQATADHRALADRVRLTVALNSLALGAS